MWYLVTDENQYLATVIATNSLFTFTERVKFESEEEAQAFLDREADLLTDLMVTNIAPCERKKNDHRRKG